MRYEFRIGGVVSDRIADTFPEFERLPVPDQTVFSGPVIDEAHLYGVLNRFQSLGLHVLEMRQLPGAADSEGQGAAEADVPSG